MLVIVASVGYCVGYYSLCWLL